MAATLLLVVLLMGLAIAGYFVFASFAFGAGYQPTPRDVVTRMLDLAEVGPSDTLYDLGAGTGAIVFRAARERGARVVGVEVEPVRVLILRLRRLIGGPRDRVRIVWGNLRRFDLSGATVVAVFLWPPMMEVLKTRFVEDLPAGTRIVSYWHPIEGWTPSVVDGRRRVYLYRRPDPRGDALPAHP
ncbi:MAG: SAM-dependent methyltransferase [Thermoplasmata archaeon]